MAFEVFKKKGRRATQGTFITITPQKTFILSHDCHQKYFKESDAVILLYDPELNHIGLKPLKDEEELPYSLKITRKSNRMHVITANAFLNHYKIDYSQRRKYEPSWNESEGLVEIDLNNPL